jgi:para-aminobenzoate synthetase component I
LNRTAAIEQMNKWGEAEQPFIAIIDFKMENIEVVPLPQSAKHHIFYDFNGQTNYHERSSLGSFFFDKYPIAKAIYAKGFEIVQAGLMRGDSFLVNLTFPTAIVTDLNLEQIFAHSKAAYKLWFKNQFVCFSPEIFVKIDTRGTISSYPMKGTINAALPKAEEIILNDLKEKAEHHTIVDLIRNDLSQVAKKVRVNRFRYVDTIKTNEKTLLQVSSEIGGQLPYDWKKNIGNILFRLLPAGSISGAPKQSTIQIIEAAELDKRGFYTGVMAIFDGQTLDSAVMIRFIEQDERGEKKFRSGGGVTIFSDLDTEYQELIDKVYVPIVGNNRILSPNESNTAIALSS